MIRSKFQIPITELEEPLSFRIDNLTAHELNIDIEKVLKFHKISAVVKLTKSTLGILAIFDVNFMVDLLCVRCLEPSRKEFAEHAQLEYVGGSDHFSKAEKVELRPGDINRVYYTGAFIDISVGIREALILAIPVAPVCSDDCPGLCPLCGKNLKKGKCSCKKEKTGLFIAK